MEAAKSLFSRLIRSVVIPAAIIGESLYIFNSLADIPFLLASVMAFTIGFYAIYLVFKYWINIDKDKETPEQQMTRYMVIFIINLGINTEIVYLLVTYLYVPPLSAQIIAAVIVAYESYYAYRSLVFRASRRKTIAEELTKGRSAVVNDMVQAENVLDTGTPLP